MTKKIVFLFFFSLIQAVSCFAQQKAKFHIVSFAENPHDMSPKTHEKLDSDGNPYAIIKVKSDNSDDDLSAYSFDFEHIPHLVEAKDGELWVYVGRNAMYVNISRDGYHSIKRYDLGLTIQPGRAYDMRLSAEAKIIAMQFLLFEITPADSKAVVMLSERGQEKMLGIVDEEGCLAKKLTIGKYGYRIVSENYHESEGLVELTTPNGKHIEKVTLRPNFAHVTLNVDSGADIYINDDKKATGAWNGILVPGVYSIECRKPGHKSSYETITVEEGRDIIRNLKSPVPITGMLSLSSAPLRARITIDGKDYGETPDIIDSLIIGNHKVTVSKDGYLSQEFEVTITENEIFERSVELKQKQQDTSKSNVSVRKKSTQKASGTLNGHDWVDLGLPSGLKWATCNVGASSPEGYGNYYAWCETSTKSSYTEANSTTYGKQISSIAGNSTYDVAHAKWRGSWRLPTKAEFEELLDEDNCIWEWTTQSGVKGCRVTSKINGESIFLPAAGFRNGTSLYEAGSEGYYWSSTPNESNTDFACYLYFSSECHYRDWFYRYRGRTVRPVTE